MIERFKQFATFENSVILVGILISTFNAGLIVAMLFV